MIGIISHVEALKEHIPAQIRVEKGGVSGTRGWWRSNGGWQDCQD
jgi:DNA repair exonuclease SbcCD ATPase subunit